MAKRRTKKDKIIAKLRREVKSRAAPSPEKSTKKEKVENSKIILEPQSFLSPKEVDYNSLFPYDYWLLKKDLAKTVVISIAFFAIIIGINIFLN